MKLISARVTNYKNIIDSGDFTLDDVTCLVGKNQSGKSTLLQALYRLNPVEKGLYGFNYESDYPKEGATEYSKGMDRDDSVPDAVVAGRFALDDEDMEAIKSDLGENSLVGDKREIVIRIDYNESRVWHGLGFDELQVLTHLTMNSSISEPTKDFINQMGSIDELRKLYERPEFNEFDEALRQEIIEFRDQNQYLIELGVVLYAINKILVSRLPSFVYYDEYSHMRDRIALHEFIDKLESDRLDASDLPMLGMLRLGGLEPRDLIDQSRSHERSSTELETAEMKITSAIRPYWNVGSEFRTVLSVVPFTEADDPGRVGQQALRVRISDARDEPTSQALTTSLNNRSRGFQWMFSFACLLRYLEDEYERLVVLLDEPGLSLHGDAQRELVELIHSQSGPTKQFVYTTHSPFMIDPDRFDMIRIVDGSDPTKGAVVRTGIDCVGRDSLLPLQSALGYSVLTPLMIGPNILFVEGVSDLVYLRAWQLQMSEEGRESLDDRWSIVPSNGVGKIPALLSFFYERENLRLAALCDGRSSAQDALTSSIQRRIIKRNRIVYLADHLERKNADIEDLFDTGTYLAIFNKTTGNDLKIGDLPTGPSRIIQRLKGASLNGIEQVDNEAFHYRCANVFERDATHFFSQLSDQEKDRIEGLFKTLNSMLGTAPKGISP